MNRTSGEEWQNSGVEWQNEKRKHMCPDWESAARHKAAGNGWFPVCFIALLLPQINHIPNPGSLDYQLKETFLVLSWSNQLSSSVLSVLQWPAVYLSSLSIIALGEVEMNIDQNQRATTSTVSLESRGKLLDLTPSCSSVPMFTSKIDRNLKMGERHNLR